MSLVTLASSNIPLTLIVATSAFGLLLICTRFSTRNLYLGRGVVLPPSVKNHWLWGYRIPKTFIFRECEQIAQSYGPIFTLRTGPSFIPFLCNMRVVVARVDAAVNILERQGSSTADRPRSVSAGETLSGGLRMVFMSPSERYRKSRKALHSHLHPGAVKEYADIQQRLAKMNILNCAKNGDIQHQKHAKLYAAALVMFIAYGRDDISSYSHPSILTINRCFSRVVNNILPGIWKVDTFPLLKYFPGYLDGLKKWHREELELFKSEMAGVSKKMSNGDLSPTSPCFGRYLLERKSELDASDDEIAYLAGSLFGAGSDTTASALSIVILASVLHPEYQQALQRELDNFLLKNGDSKEENRVPRPPTFEDIDQGVFPRLTAFVWETMRWRPVAPAGISHRANKDVVYENYVIPAGTEIINNIWSISRDPEYFPDPEKFNPSRWLQRTPTQNSIPDDSENTDVFLQDVQVSLDANLKRKALHNFGFGRRVCPGQWMATRSVLINCALYHWAFDILPYSTDKDPQAWPIDPLNLSFGGSTHPAPFKVTFRDRLGGRLEELLDGYGQL